MSIYLWRVRIDSTWTRKNRLVCDPKPVSFEYYLSLSVISVAVILVIFFLFLEYKAPESGAEIERHMCVTAVKDTISLFTPASPSADQRERVATKR